MYRDLMCPPHRCDEEIFTFRAHDYNNDTRLDGLEVLKSFESHAHPDKTAEMSIDDKISKYTPDETLF